MRIFINVGHGGSDSGAVANGLKEKDIVLNIAKKIGKQLKDNYSGAVIKVFRDSDTFYSLKQITNKANAWKADIFVSIHVNAGGGAGFESYIYNGKVSKATEQNQKVIHGEIMKEIKKYGVKDRGMKTKNLHVLRESKMSALLTENMFIDTASDVKLLKNNSFISSVVKGHVNGIAKVAGLEKKTVKTNKVFYRVVTGSFTDKKNAEKRVKDLEKKGFNSFIDIYKD